MDEAICTGMYIDLLNSNFIHTRMLILQEQDQNGFYEHPRFLILELCNLWRKFNVFISELVPFVYM